jgi:hypothetical protein
VNNGRAVITVTSGQGFAYGSIIDNQNGAPTTEYATIRAPDAATQYVNQNLPNDVVWLDNDEARFIVGQYLDGLTTELNNTPGSPGTSTIRTYLQHLIDGVCSPTNEEFWRGFDPFLWASTASKVEFYATAGNCAQPYVDDTPLPSDSMQRIHENIIRPGLIAFAQQNPAHYNNFQTPPSWGTQDPNP